LVEDLSLPTINDNGVKIIDGAAWRLCQKEWIKCI
jgi:hypothetical protein